MVASCVQNRRRPAVYLETERLILRDFIAEDWPAVLAYQHDERYLRYYPHTARTAADVRAFVQMFLDQQRAEPRLKFQPAIVLKQSGQLIGNCGLRLDAPDSHEADMGFELAPDHWGNGYATEAAQAILRVGFGEMGLHRIWAACIAENQASARVLQKLGMRLEGLLRDKECFKDRKWDVCLYAILAPEWEAQPV